MNELPAAHRMNRSGRRRHRDAAWSMEEENDDAVACEGGKKSRRAVNFPADRLLLLMLLLTGCWLTMYIHMADAWGMMVFDNIRGVSAAIHSLCSNAAVAADNNNNIVDKQNHIYCHVL